MDILVVSLVAMFASFMTFMSGFGLGTLLLPAFALYFPINIAIAMTALVHLINNLFKFFLMKNHIDWKVVLLFVLPAMIFAIFGASLLNYLADFNLDYHFTLFGKSLVTSPIRIVIALLMLIFALFDLIPQLRELSFSRRLLPLGGALSGFFGGLSGHQGALRSTFLVKAGLEKEVYIATGIFSSLMVDIVRLPIYGLGDTTSGMGENWLMLTSAIITALIGAIIGKFYLKKITINFIRILIGTLLIFISLSIGIGIL